MSLILRLHRFTLLIALSSVLLPSTTIVAQDLHNLDSIDTELRAYAKAIPGFGGVYDDHGRTRVLLTDAGDADQVRRLITDAAIERADFGVIQLLDWRDALKDVLAVPRVVLLDMDERRNRVVVGVEPGARTSVLPSLLTHARDAGVPRQALVVEEHDPVHELATLTSTFRPAPGSVEINYPGFLCTLGFNIRLGGGARGFVTNSHCSNVSGSVDGTLYRQPFAGTFIASETADPPFFAGGFCPTGRVCRISDAAIATYSNPNDAQLAKIARVKNGSNQVSGRFTIRRRAATTPTGVNVTKIGRSTNRTNGLVTNTCVNVNVAGTNITYLCQTAVAALATAGDSGSSVFTVINPVNRTVRLRGLLWGGNATQYFFSPLGNLEFELGPLSEK